jgi:D-serine deaminase-like pyridoxal phosphate-dependent protein
MRMWYSINNVTAIDTPALVVYPDRIIENIRILKQFISDVSYLRPHVKTHKSREVTALMLQEGITKFKCATIAEAEMLAEAGVKDILLAYQPVGPKIARFIALLHRYPSVHFSCLVDDAENATAIHNEAKKDNLNITVYLDLNVGMNRTGVSPEHAYRLFEHLQTLSHLRLHGLHAYDGHIRDVDLSERTIRCHEAFHAVEQLHQKIASKHGITLEIVAGGTPTFPIHAKRNSVFCSPGTFVYWDKGYEMILPEQPFLFAALILCRVISKPTNDIICVDLGHKAIAAENSLQKRIYFLDHPHLEPIGQSEEHLTLRTTNDASFQVGDVLYGVPHHICPTVALHDRVAVVRHHVCEEYWENHARNRFIRL